MSKDFSLLMFFLCYENNFMTYKVVSDDTVKPIVVKQDHREKLWL